MKRLFVSLVAVAMAVSLVPAGSAAEAPELPSQASDRADEQLERAFADRYNLPPGRAAEIAAWQQGDEVHEVENLSVTASDVVAFVAIDIGGGEGPVTPFSDDLKPGQVRITIGATNPDDPRITEVVGGLRSPVKVVEVPKSTDELHAEAAKHEHGKVDVFTGEVSRGPAPDFEEVSCPKYGGHYGEGGRALYSDSSLPCNGGFSYHCQAAGPVRLGTTTPGVLTAGHCIKNKWFWDGNGLGYGNEASVHNENAGAVSTYIQGSSAGNPYGTLRARWYAHHNKADIGVFTKWPTISSGSLKARLWDYARPGNPPGWVPIKKWSFSPRAYGAGICLQGGRPGGGGDDRATQRCGTIVDRYVSFDGTNSSYRYWTKFDLYSSNRSLYSGHSGMVAHAGATVYGILTAKTGNGRTGWYMQSYEIYRKLNSVWSGSRFYCQSTASSSPYLCTPS